ncbi:MAG: hypothetical protein P1U57_14560, partial [Oleibacter sp.]|nr:hypothetical protein [Thalassolituus sp.]
VFLVIPLAAVLLYKQFAGSTSPEFVTDPTPRASQSAAAAQMQNQAMPSASNPNTSMPSTSMSNSTMPSMQNNPAMNASMSELAQRLRKRLEEQTPNDVSGWFLLGRTYMEENDYVNAVYAYKKASALSPSDPKIIEALTQAMAMLPNDSMQSQPNMSMPAMPSSESNESVLAAAPIIVKLSITMDASLANQANANDALFVYIKAVGGPRFPLAAKRLSVANLPVTLELSDADAMMPGTSLANFSEFLVGARVSKSGNAITQPGDLFGEVTTQNLTQPINISIAQTK